MVHGPHDLTDDDLDALLATGEIPDALAQRADESAVTYATFLRYLRLGHTRSIHALAVAEQRDERWLERLSSRYHWRARLALYNRLRLRAQLLDILRDACQTTTVPAVHAPAVHEAHGPHGPRGRSEPAA